MEASRRQLIEELEKKFQPFTDVLYAKVQSQQFYFSEQRTAHLLHADQKLIIRHALPYCITEEAYFEADERSTKFLAAVILLHSLALTRMDDYYDGGSKTKQTGQLNVSALAYSLSATHEAMETLLKQTPDARKLASLLNVTNFVHSRMYKDYTERYQVKYLHSSQRRLLTYLHSPKSRLLGSGYWEVMARASFVQRGKAFPAYLHGIDLKLRKFRQIIDEFADIKEDLRGGLITLPILHVLTHHPRPTYVRRVIKSYWNENAAVEDLYVSTLLREAKTDEWVNTQAMMLYAEAMRELDNRLGRRGDGYRRLFEYKKAKLEALMAQGV